jgi:3-phosphoshikimate 1-carboxyvinyltransferase
MHFKLLPGGALKGEARVPGDKSISHRAIMLGALSDGTTQISGFLEGEDALATLAAFRAMGVEIEGPTGGRVSVRGVGLHGLQASVTSLDLGNAGTGMRLLCGLLAGQTFDSELTGDASLCTRPMGRVIDPLMKMGADIQSADGGRPPLKIHGSRQLQGIHYDLPMASAQVKSCLLLAGLYAGGRTSVTEPAPTRDHTERMLRGFGYPVQCENGVISLQGGGNLTAGEIDVPADISSAAFLLVAASIAPGSDLTLTHVGINPTRTGVLNILQLMGADITMDNQREVGGEPVADIRVRHAPLRGIDIPLDQVPLAIDEFPVLFIAAACAEGRTVLRGAEELRVKESDRITAMAEGLNTLGVVNEVLQDGIIIEGGTLGGGVIHTHHDHRIAMSFAVAALRAQDEITVLDCDHVATSFPDFDALTRSLGLHIEKGDD